MASPFRVKPALENHLSALLCSYAYIYKYSAPGINENIHCLFIEKLRGGGGLACHVEYGPL